MTLRRAFIMLIASSALLGQPVERPPRPGEPIKPWPRESVKPAVERGYRKKKELRPMLTVAGGTLLIDNGSWCSASFGATLGNLGFGLQTAYTDYEREFVGSRSSYVSPGDLKIVEKGSFFRPAAYIDYAFDIGALRIIPRATLGYSEIVCRRVDKEAPADSSRFERRRLANTWEFDIELPMGRFQAGVTVQWWVVNPWFYLYPEDFGLLTVGGSIGIR